MPCVDCQKEVKGNFIRCFPCNKKFQELKVSANVDQAPKQLINCIDCNKSVIIMYIR